MRSRLAAGGAIAASASAICVIAFATLGMVIPASSVDTAAPAAPGLHSPAVAYPAAADFCYVDAMIPHHQQALELSRLVLDAEGSHARVRALADFIVRDQSAEIADMRAWSDAWAQALPEAGHASAPSVHAGHSTAPAPSADGCDEHDTHARMAGMATSEQLAQLAAADGREADRLFLELMIAHHIGALEMATAAVMDGTNAFVRASAKHVLIEQEREVQAMETLLADVP